MRDRGCLYLSHLPIFLCAEDVKHVLFCGDQLTVERARHSQENCVNSSSKREALLGLEPTISDWHAEANFLQVCFTAWACLFVCVCVFVE